MIAAVHTLALLLLATATGGHECIHHRIAKSMGPLPAVGTVPGEVKATDGGERHLEEFPVRAIRIKPDYTYVETEDDDFKTYLKATLFPRISAFFQRFLSVNDETAVPKFSSTGCDNLFSVPTSYSDSTTDTDLVIFFTVTDEDASYLAYASPCLIRARNNRPVVGLVNINMKHVSYGKVATESMLYTLVHEVMHVLAFAPSLYSLFQQPEPIYVKEEITTNAGTIETYKLVTPKLVALAKSHYGCETIDGVLLENEGDQGSVGAHFEKLHYGNEVMTAAINSHPIFSVFSLGILEDSGWYIVDYTKAERLIWGKDRGCSFYNNETCLEDVSEYCSSSGSVSCSSDYMAMTYCMSTNFSDSCLINEFFSSFMCGNRNTAVTDEPVMPGNRCFKYEGMSPTTGCFNSKCVDGKIVIVIDGEDHVCSEATEDSPSQVTYAWVTIECPDPVDFCAQFAGRCPNDCNFKGKCLEDGTCGCYAFYQGEECGEDRKCTSEEASICELVNPGGEIESTNTDDETEDEQLEEEDSTGDGGNVVETEDNTGKEEDDTGDGSGTDDNGDEEGDGSGTDETTDGDNTGSDDTAPDSDTDDDPNDNDNDNNTETDNDPADDQNEDTNDDQDSAETNTDEEGDDNLDGEDKTENSICKPSPVVWLLAFGMIGLAEAT